MRPITRVAKKSRFTPAAKSDGVSSLTPKPRKDGHPSSENKAKKSNPPEQNNNINKVKSCSSSQPEEFNDNPEAIKMEEILRKNKQLELIINISRQFSATLDFNHLMVTIFEKVIEAMRAEAGSFWIPDPKTQENICTIAEGPAKKQVQGLRLKQGDGIVGWVIDNKLNTTIFDASHDPRFSGKVDEKTKFVTKSMLCVPMLVANECVGAIQVINKRSENGQFNEIDLDMLENLANSAAIAIKNARLFESEKKINDLSTLLKISEELTSTLDLDRVLLSIVNLSSQAIDYTRAVIALLDNSEQVYIAAESNEIQPDLKAEENISLKEILEYVISTGSPLHIANYSKENPQKGIPDFVNEYMNEYELHSLSVIILSDSEGKLGLLSLEGSTPVLIPPESESVINTLANQSSIAIRNAQLYQNITSSSIADRFKAGFKFTPKTRRKILISALAISIILIIALLIPLPANIQAKVEIIPEHKTQVTAFSPGVVKSVLFKEGDKVKKGQILFKLDTALLYLEKIKLSNDLLITQSKLRQLEREGNPAEIYMTQLESQKLQNKLDAANRQMRFATIRANRSGVILTKKPYELVDKQITQGEVVAEIASLNRKNGQIHITELDILNVKQKDKASIALQSIPGAVIRGSISEISQLKVEDEEGNQHYIAYFTSEQLNKISSVRFGMTGRAKIYTGSKTLYESTIKKTVVLLITRIKLMITH